MYCIFSDLSNKMNTLDHKILFQKSISKSSNDLILGELNSKLHTSASNTTAFGDLAGDQAPDQQKNASAHNCCCKKEEKHIDTVIHFIGSYILGKFKYMGVEWIHVSASLNLCLIVSGSLSAMNRAPSR